MKFFSLTCFLLLHFSAFAQNATLPVETFTGGPRLTLVLNENYLLSYMMVRSSSHADVIAFQNAAWELNESAYREIRAGGEKPPMSYSKSEFLNRYGNYFETLKSLPQYLKVRRQTWEYAHAAAAEWNRNLTTSVRFMRHYSGFALNREFSVFITHPAIGNGKAHVDSGNVISFGALPEFENYFTVYMWHEILHFYMPPTNASHVAIQLLTDNDLRVFLNGGFLYPLQGHAGLQRAMRLKMPAWRQYKKAPTDLNDFVARAFAQGSTP